jgi:hypothetical protein
MNKARTKTHKKDVEVCERKPSEYKIERVVRRFHHQGDFANCRVIAAPYLGDMYQRIYSGKKRPIQPTADQHLVRGCLTAVVEL